MNELKKLGNHEIHERTFRAAENEKRATLELLEYLAEVDRRRLYAEKACSSLWEYVHKFLNYSEAQASERVSATRLMRKLPEVKVALGAGRLTLTSTAKLASFVRREGATAAQALDLLQKCENQSSRAVEKILVANATQEIPLPEKVRAISPKITRITFEVDEEFMDLVQRMKELKGNPGLEVREVFKSAMREYVKKRETKQSEAKQSEAKQPDEMKVAAAKPAQEDVVEKSLLGITQSKSSATSGARSEEGTGGKESTIEKPSRYIPVAVKNRVRLRSGDRCEFRNADGRRCESRHGLEFDHRIPFAKGGTGEFENLRHLCKTHNLHHAIQVFGARKMRRFLRTQATLLHPSKG